MVSIKDVVLTRMISRQVSLLTRIYCSIIQVMEIRNKRLQIAITRSSEMLGVMSSGGLYRILSLYVISD